MTSLNPQERALLQEFLQRLIQIRGIEKDPHADALIAQAVAQQPDAAYLLVQRALLLEQALDAAKVEIAQLNDRLRGGGERGFLAEANRWGQSEQTAQRATLSVSGRPIPAEPASASPAPVALPSRAPLSGFLGQAAATAAGVAGGAFLFQVSRTCSDGTMGSARRNGTNIFTVTPHETRSMRCSRPAVHVRR